MASQVTTAAEKTVSGRSPYVGKTFQRQTGDIFGRDGYLSGGLTTDNGATITVAPFKMVSRGIIGEAIAASSLDVPTSPEPWYIVASLPDDDPDSGIVVQVTRSLQQAATGVVIASKSGDVWRNPHPVDIAGASQRASEPGPEEGFSGNYDNTGGVYGGTDGTTVVDKIFANNGRVVTPEGVRIVTNPLDGESGKQLEITPRPASSTGRRTDRIVLRQREPFSEEIAYLMGGTQEGGAAASIGTGTSAVGPHYYAKRGGTELEQWWAWGNGADLHIYGGIAGGAFGDTTLLSGTAITHVWFAGQRAADDALILLYIDGGNLQMVSFNAATGAIVDASTNLDALPNAVNRVAATLDSDEIVHVVFEYDDGAEQQAYYAKFVSATATWATVAKTPNYAVGANSSFNDTKPLVKVCRNGIAHIVFIRGTGSNEYGDLVYARMDTSGNPIDNSVYAAATDVAEPIDQSFVDFSDGFAQVAYHSFTHISLTLTPHDELYVGIGAGRGSQTPAHVLLFSPELSGRLGFSVVQVRQENPAHGVGIVSDDAGEVILVASYSAIGFIFRVILYLGTQPGARGSDDIVISTGNDAGTGSAITAPPFAELGPTGEMVHSLIAGTDVRYSRDQGAAIELTGLPAELHPNDLLLTSIDVDSNAGGVIEEQGIEIFQARHKKKNYPIVVGKQGDYLGYGSLHLAINAISKDGGGEVVLRSGHHFVNVALNVPANVSLSGENGAVIEGDVTIEGFRVNTNLIYGNVIEDNVALDLGTQVPGFWCLLDTSGWHRVRKILRPRESDGGMRILLSDGIDGAAPAHAGVFVYFPASGGHFENITVNGDLTVQWCRQYTIRNVSVIGTSAIFTSGKNWQCLFENIDLTQASSAASAAIAGNGEYNIYKDFRFADARGLFEIDDSEAYPTLIGCRGDDANPANATYNLDGTRTNPVYTVGCEGRFTFTAGNEDFLIANVGKVVRQPEGLGTLEFDDDETRADSGPLALTVPGSGTATFNGATPNVIVDSINERVKKAGDTMSGNLIMAANLVTDAATRVVGNLAGAVGTRFNVGANLLNVLGLGTFQDGVAIAKSATLGSALLGTEANAEIARIDMGASNVAGGTMTLIEEVNTSLGGGSWAVRKYVDGLGRTYETVNAKFSNATNLFTKDLNNNEASLKSQEGFNLVLKVRKFDEDAPWSFGGWTYTGLNVQRNGLVLPETIETIPLHEGEVGYPGGGSYYKNTAGGGSHWGCTNAGTKWVEFTVLKVPGRRLVALTITGTSGSGAGEELQAKLWERDGVSSGATQKGGTKTSGLANGLDSVGWTDADADIKYTLPSSRSLTLAVRLPNFAFDTVSIFGIVYTWDQPQP